MKLILIQVFALSLLLFGVYGCASGPEVHADYIASENLAVFHTDAVAAEWGTLRATSLVPMDTLEASVTLTLYLDHTAAALGCSTWRLAMAEATEAPAITSFSEVDGQPVITILLDLATLAALEVGSAVGFELCGRTFEASPDQLEALAVFGARILAALDALRGTQ
jgi:hypothetical protein